MARIVRDIREDDGLVDLSPSWVAVELIASPSTSRPETWQDRAACAGLQRLDLFFPPPGNNEAFQRAKRICASCPVRLECVTAVFEGDAAIRDCGIRGGKSGKSLSKLRMRWERGLPLDLTVHGVMPDRVCDVCGATYIPLHNNQKRCSKKCAAAIDYHKRGAA